MSTAIRRARKSLPERRLNGLQRELDSNLERVEMRAHLKAKKDRAVARARRGEKLEPIPDSVKRGLLTEELYGVECRLHREAGLPPPPRPRELMAAEEEGGGGGAGKAGARRIGLVPFERIMRQMVAMFHRTNGNGGRGVNRIAAAA